MTRDLEPTSFTRYFIYPLFFLIFVSVFFILFIFASGYKFTFKEGKIDIQKTGMIIVATRPSGADIFIDGKDKNRRTGFYFLPTKINNLVPGSYKLTLKKEGYRTWVNDLNVIPEIVTWANYALLFKEELEFESLNLPQNTEIVKNLDSENISNDILLKGTENNLTSFYFYDASKDSFKKVWPPSNQINDSFGSGFEVVGEKLNKANNKAVIYVKKSGAMEHYLLDFSKEAPSLISLPLFYNKTFSDFIWDTTGSASLFALSGSDLFRINTENSVIGEVIVENVVDFSVEKTKKVYYITNDNTGYALSRMNLDGSEKVLVSEIIAKSKNYKISYSDNTESLAVLSYDDGKLYIYKNLSDRLSLMRLTKDALGFSWSKDGEKIFYYDDHTIKGYDFEKQEETQVKLDDKIVSLDWYFDNCHYLVQTEKEFFIIDFDGANKVVINDTAIVNYANYIEGEIIFSYLNDKATEYKKFVPAF